MLVRVSQHAFLLAEIQYFQVLSVGIWTTLTEKQSLAIQILASIVHLFLDMPRADKGNIRRFNIAKLKYRETTFYIWYMKTLFLDFLITFSNWSIHLFGGYMQAAAVIHLNVHTVHYKTQQHIHTWLVYKLYHMTLNVHSLHLHVYTDNLPTPWLGNYDICANYHWTQH